MKEIQARNLYAVGHEQQRQRPYVIVYEGDKNYVLAFPVTTEAKQRRNYPSHKNIALSNNSELMLDQLSIIINKNIVPKDCSDFVAKLQQLKYHNVDKNAIMQHFLKNILLQKETKQTYKIQFGDIIELKHSNPLLMRKKSFVVLSCGIFHQSQMCCIAPYNKEAKTIEYQLLHCIDFVARELNKITSLNLNKKKIADEINLSLNNDMPMPRKVRV